ncbi:hypothetical protein M885DRAFT_518012 [Pelagophyceae sp. CCMP2097]|nr:hypothetical protein M885DRAFT_518012 [Pelagophyceae sp. CCMP2097]
MAPLRVAWAPSFGRLSRGPLSVGPVRAAVLLARPGAESRWAAVEEADLPDRPRGPSPGMGAHHLRNGVGNGVRKGVRHTLRGSPSWHSTVERPVSNQSDCPRNRPKCLRGRPSDRQRARCLSTSGPSRRRLEWPSCSAVSRRGRPSRRGRFRGSLFESVFEVVETAVAKERPSEPLPSAVSFPTRMASRDGAGEVGEVGEVAAPTCRFESNQETGPSPQGPCQAGAAPGGARLCLFAYARRSGPASEKPQDGRLPEPVAFHSPRCTVPAPAVGIVFIRPSLEAPLFSRKARRFETVAARGTFRSFCS